MVFPFGNGSYCGACIRVKGERDVAVFRVTEHCAEADCGTKAKILLTPKAMLRVSGRSSGYSSVTWEIVECPNMSSNLQYRITAQSMPFFISFQVLNPRYPVIQVEVNTRAGFVIAKPNLSKSFTATGSILIPLEIRITDVNGSKVIDTIPNPNLELEIQKGTVQLPLCFPKFN
jgi:expansin (peptidoglycan-binding protein)